MTSLQVLSLAQTDLPAQEGSKGKLRIDRCLDPFRYESWTSGYPKFEVAVTFFKWSFKYSLESIDNTQPFPSSYIYLSFVGVKRPLQQHDPNVALPLEPADLVDSTKVRKYHLCRSNKILPNKYYRLLDLLVTSNITYLYICRISKRLLVQVHQFSIITMFLYQRSAMDCPCRPFGVGALAEFV